MFERFTERVRHLREGQKEAARPQEKEGARRNAGTITSKDLPKGLTFPGGPLKGKTLKQVRELCK